MKNRKWGMYLSLLVVLIIAPTLIIRARNNGSSKGAIKEISPTYGNIQTSVPVTATVQPEDRLEIKPPIPGRVDHILVEEGQKVKIGQVLAWMSSTERAVLLDAARGNGEKDLKYWEDACKPTPLLSQINGEVIVKSAMDGQTVACSDDIVVLSDYLIVQGQADETDIGKIKLGQKALITLDAYPEIRIEGTVVHIYYESNIINNVTIYRVDVLPKKVPEVFRSGMSATLNFIVAEKENVLLIPLEAVKQDNQGSFVLLSQNKGNVPLKKRVKLGISDDKNVEVISGLTPEDKIVITTEKYLPSKIANAGSTGSPFMPVGGRGR
jgi:macrolide-specific efflux system membrane fusion protein